jgi:hypothetical protein
MTVAEVIGGTGQFEGIGAGNVQQLFGTGTDTHDPPVFGLQALAVIQGRLTSFQKQPDVFTVGTETAQTAFTPGFEGQVQLCGPDGLRVDSVVNHQHR